MEDIGIDQAVLSEIFLEQEHLGPLAVKQIISWNQELEPSVNLTKSLISAFLLPSRQEQAEQSDLSNKEEQHTDMCLKSEKKQQGKERLTKAVENVPQLLRKLHELKCPKNFIRAFLFFLRQNYELIEGQINLKHILESWQQLSPELLENYCDTFRISIENYSTKQKEKESPLQISSEQFDKAVQRHIEKKEYNWAMILIKMANCQKHHINKLLQKMTNNRQASKAADYIKSLKLNSADYPALGERLYKNTARHFLSKNGWEYAEEIFEEHPEALACVVEDLVFKKKFKEALSVWSRHPICREHIVKEDSLKFFKPYSENDGAGISPEDTKVNFLHSDTFGPIDIEKHLTLEELGYREQDVIWVDENTENTDGLMKGLMESDYLGIDTESIVGQTKFEKSNGSKFQEAALIQIANNSKVYLIDGFVAKKIPAVKQMLMGYIKKGGLIVGHTLDNDMECLLKSLGCSDEEIKALKNIKMVDIWKLFKAIYPKKKYSSLAYITETTLGKALCKDQTLTNWKRRPLRKNQLHYAAMDAVVVIKIYQKFIEQFGEQMIEYYCEMSSHDF